MRDLVHKDKKCGVEGDFVIDLDGNLKSPTVDMRTLGLQVGQTLHVNGAFVIVASEVTRRCVTLEDHVLPAGPARRVYYGVLWRNRPAPSDAYDEAWKMAEGGS